MVCIHEWICRLGLLIAKTEVLFTQQISMPHPTLTSYMLHPSFVPWIYFFFFFCSFSLPFFWHLILTVINQETRRTFCLNLFFNQNSLQEKLTNKEVLNQILDKERKKEKVEVGGKVYSITWVGVGCLMISPLAWHSILHKFNFHWVINISGLSIDLQFVIFIGEEGLISETGHL